MNCKIEKKEEKKKEKMEKLEEKKKKRTKQPWFEWKILSVTKKDQEEEIWRESGRHFRILAKNILLHWAECKMARIICSSIGNLEAMVKNCVAAADAVVVEARGAGLSWRRSSQRKPVKAKTSAASSSSTPSFTRTSWRVCVGLAMNLSSKDTTSVCLSLLAISRAV